MALRPTTGSWNSAARLLAEGRISQAEFSAEADRISVQGFEAYRKAVKDGNTELANAVKAQIEAQAKIAWGAMQAKGTLDSVTSRALDAMISLTTAGSQAGGILGWVAGMTNGVLTIARQARGQLCETVPSWDEYWQGVRGDWAELEQGAAAAAGRARPNSTEESKRLKDQIRDMQLQGRHAGLVVGGGRPPDGPAPAADRSRPGWSQDNERFDGGDRLAGRRL